MPTFRCTNPKNYKLTLNKTYDVLEDLDHSIKTINDNNKVVNYHKSLFTEVVTEPEVVVETAPTPPPARTEQDVINSVVVLNNSNIRFTDLQNNEVTIQGYLSYTDTSISCGINQIYGINDTIESIEEDVDTSDEDLIELKQLIFRTFIQRIVQSMDNVRYFLLSTNFNSSYEDYYSVLDNLSQGSFGWEENPNSGNDIKLWVLNRNIV